MENDSLNSASELFLDWLQIEKGRSPRTIASYRQDLRRFENSLEFRPVEVRTALPEDIDFHLSQLKTENRSPATIARSRSCLRSFYKFLVEEGEVDQDPTVSAGSIKVPSRLPKALNEEDALWLLESVDGTDPLARRDRAILELLYGTGARVSEVSGLDLSDMAYDDGLLRLVGKGDKERLVPLGRAAQEAIGLWLTETVRDRFLIQASPSRDDLQALFLNRNGRRLTRQGIHLMVQQRGRRAGIKSPVSPHVLRHSCASHMLAHGADVRVVQELLGHASVATTQIYTRVTNDHLIAAYAKAHPRASLSP